MHSTNKALMAALAALVAGPALACFTVYDRNNQVIYSAQIPPVDMSRPLHETLPQAYPGGHLVFDGSSACPVLPPARQMRVTSTPGRSPLLTDTATAQSLGLQHTVVADGIALVRDRPDNMRPGVNLADSGLPAEPDTRSMGAGPARPGTGGTMGANPARPAAPGSAANDMLYPWTRGAQPAPQRSR